MHRGQHVRMPMPQAGYCCPAGSVDISFSLSIGQINTLAADRHRRRSLQMPMKYMGGHCGHKNYLLTKEFDERASADLSLRLSQYAPSLSSRSCRDCRRASTLRPPRTATAAAKASASANAPTMEWKYEELSARNSKT